MQSEIKPRLESSSQQQLADGPQCNPLHRSELEPSGLFGYYLRAVTADSFSQIRIPAGQRPALGILQICFRLKFRFQMEIQTI